MAPQAIETLARSGAVSSNYVVRAPISGRVVEYDVTLGQYVSPDKDTLMQLADSAALWVIADVPAAALPEIAIGAAARVTAPASGQTFTGAVAFIPPTVDPSTRSAPVRIDVRDETSRLKPGMFARVEVEEISRGAEGRPNVVVPEEALQVISGQTCVFVADEDEPNTFVRRAVAAGPEVNGLVPIFSGLKEGEAVVEAGSFLLKAELARSATQDTD